MTRFRNIIDRSLFALGLIAQALCTATDVAAAPKSQLYFRCRPGLNQKFSFSAEGTAEIATAPDRARISPAKVNFSSLSLAPFQSSSSSLPAVIEKNASSEILHLRFTLGESDSKKNTLEFQIALSGTADSKLNLSTHSGETRLHSKCEAQPICKWVATKERLAKARIIEIESNLKNLPQYVAGTLKRRLDQVSHSKSQSELNRELTHQRSLLANFNGKIEEEKRNLTVALENARSTESELNEQVQNYGCPRS